jgi:hypothetical protein
MPMTLITNYKIRALEIILTNLVIFVGKKTEKQVFVQSHKY